MGMILIRWNSSRQKKNKHTEMGSKTKTQQLEKVKVLKEKKEEEEENEIEEKIKCPKYCKGTTATTSISPSPTPTLPFAEAGAASCFFGSWLDFDPNGDGYNVPNYAVYNQFCPVSVDGDGNTLYESIGEIDGNLNGATWNFLSNSNQNNFWSNGVERLVCWNCTTVGWGLNFEDSLNYYTYG